MKNSERIKEGLPHLPGCGPLAGAGSPGRNSKRAWIKAGRPGSLKTWRLNGARSYY